MADARKAALDTALKKIEKNFGKGAIMRMGDAAQTTISTTVSYTHLTLPTTERV